MNRTPRPRRRVRALSVSTLEGAAIMHGAKNGYRAYCVGGRWYVRMPNGSRSKMGSEEEAKRIAAKGNELLAARAVRP